MKVRGVPVLGLNVPEIVASTSLDILRVTVPDATSVMVSGCLAAAGMGGGVIAGFGGFGDCAVNVHQSLGSEATLPTVCTTLTLLVPGCQSAVGVKVRGVPVLGLNVPEIVASTSLDILRVTVPDATSVMVSGCLAAAGMGGGVIAGFGGFGDCAVNVHQSLGSESVW
jgi:ABC-type enterochelin transport system permease subunit